MRRLILTAFCFLACTTQLVPPPARSTEVIDRGAVSEPLRVEKVGQCSRRAGPYVTQATAKTYLQKAQGGGYSVSNDVFACSEGWGYCFNVVLSC